MKQLSPGRLIWVKLPTACCGLIVLGGYVVGAAPYLGRYVGWTETAAAADLRRRGAAFVPID
jgi:hypothetical protein